MWKTPLNVIYYRDGRKNSYPVYVVRNYYVETTFRRDNYVFITQFVCWVVNLSVMKKSTKYQNEIRELPSQIVVPTTRAASIDEKADIMAIRWIIKKIRVTGPLWGESTGHRWIPLIKATDAERWCFFDRRPNKRLSTQSRRRWLETPPRSLWHHSNILIRS